MNAWQMFPLLSLCLSPSGWRTLRHSLPGNSSRPQTMEQVWVPPQEEGRESVRKRRVAGCESRGTNRKWEGKEDFDVLSGGVNLEECVFVHACACVCVQGRWGCRMCAVECSTATVWVLMGYSRTYSNSVCSVCAAQKDTHPWWFPVCN